jgi:hydrogenase/urease accessory protein HupE
MNDGGGKIYFSSTRQKYPEETKLVATSTNTRIAASTFLSIVRQFSILGFLHILFGTDHVLFILAVHILVRRKREVFLLATSFTVAHSLTLMLASAGVITVTSRIVEPLIALSIAYTAIRNMWLYYRGNEEALRERWMTTFGFGLIHGLGFAGALVEIRIPKENFFSSLLSFNLGVEVGQLVIIAVFVTLLVYIHKRGGFKYALYVLSSLITLVSLLWFLQRLF